MSQSVAFFLIGVLVVFVISMIRILNEYERGVVFTLGRYSSTKGPGLILIIPFLQQMVKMQLVLFLL